MPRSTPTQSDEPTPRQKLLLRTIYELSVELGFAPSFREIAERMGVSSTNGITQGLNRLQKAGWLVRHNLVRRSMKVTQRGAEAAGFVMAPYPFIAP